MKRLLLLPAIGLITAPALASPDVLPYNGIAGVYNYNLATGEKVPTSGLNRNIWCSIWAATQSSGWFFPLGCNDVVLDWGDIETPASVGGFGFAYATNANHGSVDCIIAFYGDDNGWCQPNRDFVAAFYFTGLNGTLTPQDRNRYWSWIYRAAPWEPFVIDANDLDGDQLGDFSYTYWFDVAALESPDPNPKVGPLITADPNGGTPPPGAEEWFDLFSEPNYSPSPGYFDPNLTGGCVTLSLAPFSQFYMELFAPRCPNRGDAGHYCSCDCNYDCVIGLGDLACLLALYGSTTGSRLMDCYPYDPFCPGDGVIDLADLAELLSQYGDNCNWPQP
jgi:hypothetical protein